MNSDNVTNAFQQLAEKMARHSSPRKWMKRNVSFRKTLEDYETPTDSIMSRESSLVTSPDVHETSELCCGRLTYDQGTAIIGAIQILTTISLIVRSIN